MMEFNPDTLEQMAAGLDNNRIEPPITAEEEGDVILTEVRRIIKTEDGHPSELEARYEEGYKAVDYNGHEFLRYSVSPEHVAWVEFVLYPALRQKYAPDERFADVKDKGSDLWRVYLERPEQITEYRDVITDSTI